MTARSRDATGFRAIGTAAGGISGPMVFSTLVSTDVPRDTALAFATGAAVLIVAGLVEVVIGPNAERKGLESIARPLTQQS
ncbi:hypothetical protein [Streptomyces sulphureus]|uniref:hypothetical protein n=1 Tax=Streptomyces sulphureus TaxID=47758 RepID=UPI0003648CA1|nr:hypothetical protein [Streptomyces sulphureus]